MVNLYDYFHIVIITSISSFVYDTITTNSTKKVGHKDQLKWRIEHFINVSSILHQYIDLHNNYYIYILRVPDYINNPLETENTLYSVVRYINMQYTIYMYAYIYAYMTVHLVHSDHISTECCLIYYIFWKYNSYYWPSIIISW